MGFLKQNHPLLETFLVLSLIVLSVLHLDFYRVIPSKYDLAIPFYPSDADRALLEPFSLLYPLDPSEEEGVLPSLKDDVVSRAIAYHNSRHINVWFNAEISVLTPKNPVRVVGSAAVPSVFQNVTPSSVSFNAAAEALGDLFMDETYLQSNLDVDEITAVAGHVSKEDLDVQRLVDVLWSQEVDLGVSREWLEYSVCPPPPPPSQCPPKETEDPRKTLPKSLLEPYFLPPVFPGGLSFSSNSGGYVDSETGEIIGGSAAAAAAAGNDTYDPNGARTNNTNDNSNSNLDPLLSSPSNNETALEERQLQSLIEALDSLNNSTLQALEHGQSPAGRVLDEQWEDVQSVISEPATASTAPLSPYNPCSSLPSSASRIKANDMNIVDAGNAVTDLAAFDLFNMFLDPPSNWSLPAPPSPSKMNLSEFLVYPPSAFEAAAGGWAKDGPRASQNGTRPHMSRNSTDATENTSKHMRPQEGNADYSPFSYSSTLAPDQQHSQHSSHSEGRTVDPNQSFNGALLDQTNMYDWSLVDWTAPLLSLSGDMSDFSNAVTDMDYLPPVNSSGNILPVPILASNCSSIGGNDWKILQDISGCGGNNSEVLFMLDEAKMHLINAEDPFKAVVPTTSSIPVVDPQGDLLALVKDEEVDPWTEHVNYAVTHNHTYTLRGRRAGSEDGLDSSGSQAGSQSGSNSNSYRMDSGEEGTGSGPRSRSRHSRSRDDRAAMELQLPITPEDIVRMPVEEFNNYVSGQVARLQPEQIQLMKDIRRRGKNKVAAQNCRRRKLDNMGHLEGEIMKLRLELSAASARRDQVARERDNYRHTLRNSISVIQTTGLGSMDSSLNLEPPQSSSVSSSSSSTTTSIIQRNPAMKNKRYANDISHTADDPQKETLRKRKRE